MRLFVVAAMVVLWGVAYGALRLIMFAMGYRQGGFWKYLVLSSVCLFVWFFSYVFLADVLAGGDSSRTFLTGGLVTIGCVCMAGLTKSLFAATMAESITVTILSWILLVLGSTVLLLLTVELTAPELLDVF